MAWWKGASTGYFGSEGEGDGDGDGDGDGGDEERSCSNRRIVKSSCRTEEVEPGRFVRKCEKTEQLLRQCAGRPAEVVESKTEHTEEDISNEVKQGFLPFESNGSEPFTFPGLRNDLESIEREFIGGLSTFMEATEKMANELFNSFGVPSIQSSWPPLEHRRPPAHWQHDESRTSEEMKDRYADLDVEIRDV